MGADAVVMSRVFSKTFYLILLPLSVFELVWLGGLSLMGKGVRVW